MKIYDSANPPVVATAVGATVVLQANPQGTPMPDKAITGTPTRFAISNASLEYSGKRWYGDQSTITLNAVVSTNSLSIGGKNYVAGTDFAVGGNDAATAVNLAAAINTWFAETYPAWIFNAENMNFEAKVTGTGAVAATVDIEDSINGQDWANVATSPTFNLSGTGSASAKVATTKQRPHIRVKNLTLTGTNKRLEIWATPAPV